MWVWTWNSIGFSTFTARTAAKTIFPSNLAILAGSTAEMTCSLKSSMRWQFSTPTSIDRETICSAQNGSCYNANYTLVITSGDVYTLGINTSIPLHNFAGTYFCQTVKETAIAELVVLGKNMLFSNSNINSLTRQNNKSQNPALFPICRYCNVWGRNLKCTVPNGWMVSWDIVTLLISLFVVLYKI